MAIQSCHPPSIDIMPVKQSCRKITKWEIEKTQKAIQGLNSKDKIERRLIRREDRIHKLQLLKAPIAVSELRRLFNTISIDKKKLCCNPDVQYPAIFRVNLTKKKCFLEVHSPKQILLIFFNKDDHHTCISIGAFKRVYKVWEIMQPQIMAYATAKVPEGNKWKIETAGNEDKYLNLFNRSTFTVRLYANHYHINGNNNRWQVLLMKYYSLTLFDFLNKIREKKMNLLSDDVKLVLALKIMEPIAYFHKKSVVHRDIKPENILMEGSDLVYTDFGFAADMDDPKTTRLFLGTLSFMSYEVLLRKYGNTFASDIWSAGCILWLLFSDEEYPWYELLDEDDSDTLSTKERIQLALDKMLEFHENIPSKVKKLQFLLWEMLHLNLNYRPTAQEVVDRLNQMLSDLPKEDTYDLSGELKLKSQTETLLQKVKNIFSLFVYENE